MVQTVLQKLKFKRLPKSGILFGGVTSHSLENRLFNLASLLVAATGFSLLILSLFNTNSIYDLILASSVMGFGLIFYFWSIRFKGDQYLRVPLLLIVLGVITLTWITSGGLEGSTPIYLMSMFVIMRILLVKNAFKAMLAVTFCVISILVYMDLYYPELILRHVDGLTLKIDIAVSLLVSVVIVLIFVHVLVRQYRIEKDKNFKLLQQTLKDKILLQQALTELKVLRGILPVCSFCKKIRDEDDEWHQMENFISTRSEAKFSHSFCPDCGDEHYGEFITHTDK